MSRGYDGCLILLLQMPAINVNLRAFLSNVENFSRALNIYISFGRGGVVFLGVLKSCSVILRSQISVGKAALGSHSVSNECANIFGKYHKRPFSHHHSAEHRKVMFFENTPSEHEELCEVFSPTTNSISQFLFFSLLLFIICFRRLLRLFSFVSFFF